jgi:hypothetical protein
MIKQFAVGILVVAAVGSAGWLLTERQLKAQSSGQPTPILVELFTSEGCSSCPPADALLEKLDRSQPIAGAELIVLSEHVDYWNHIGWTDPYSASFYSDRQNSYAQRFGRNTVYTPQMVVDGSSEFVGSDARSADRALVHALKAPKIGVRLSPISVEGTRNLKARVETEVLPASYGPDESDIYLAIALGHAESKVSGGENSGRRLSHTSVVRGLIKIGGLRPGQSFAKDVEVKLEPGVSPQNVRLIAFIQEPAAGRVIGATMQSVAK